MNDTSSHGRHSHHAPAPRRDVEAAQREARAQKRAFMQDYGADLTALSRLIHRLCPNTPEKTNGWAAVPIIGGMGITAIDRTFQDALQMLNSARNYDPVPLRAVHSLVGRFDETFLRYDAPDRAYYVTDKEAAGLKLMAGQISALQTAPFLTALEAVIDKNVAAQGLARGATYTSL